MNEHLANYLRKQEDFNASIIFTIHLVVIAFASFLAGCATIWICNLKDIVSGIIFVLVAIAWTLGGIYLLAAFIQIGLLRDQNNNLRIIRANIASETL